MTNATIDALPRTSATKHSLHQLRAQGLVPGIVYGHQIAAQPIQLEGRILKEVLRHVSPSTVLQLTVGGGSPRSVMIKDVQYDVLSRAPRHIDFQVINMQEEVRVAIAIRLEGDPKGVKSGGVLQVGAREIEVKALPSDLPEALVVNIADLDVGDHIAVSDLKLPAKVELLDEPDQLVATVVAARIGEEELPETETVSGGPEQATSDEDNHPPDSTSR
jgi:large subunit ribosomal protein L25